MANIEVNGRIKVKSFYNAFIEAYPYLHAGLRYPDGKPVDADNTIANARSKSTEGNYSPTGDAEISVHGNLGVGTFEKRFEEVFSIKCEIHFKKAGKWYPTGAKYNAMSLNEANAALKADGAEEIVL